MNGSMDGAKKSWKSSLFASSLRFLPFTSFNAMKMINEMFYRILLRIAHRQMELLSKTWTREKMLCDRRSWSRLRLCQSENWPGKLKPEGISQEIKKIVFKRFSPLLASDLLKGSSTVSHSIPVLCIYNFFGPSSPRRNKRSRQKMHASRVRERECRVATLLGLIMKDTMQSGLKFEADSNKFVSDLKIFLLICFAKNFDHSDSLQQEIKSSIGEFLHASRAP